MDDTQQAEEVIGNATASEAPAVVPEQAPTIEQAPAAPAMRFDIKTEAKVIRAISKMFEEGKPAVSEELAIAKAPLRQYTPDHVCLIEAKTEEAKRALSRFIDAEDIQRIIKDPTIHWEEGKVGAALYSTDFFPKLLKILEESDDEGYFTIQMAKDYPAIMENQHFKIWLAPRIEND